MGAGKTLTLTYLTWKNWYSRRLKVYSNYPLYKIPYYYLQTIKQLEYMRDGVAALDELWRICDSRMSRKTSNKVVSDILARSRKRHLIYIFSAQVIDSIDKRIRKVMDFTALPVIMGRNEQETKVLIFKSGYIKHAGNYMRTIYFNNEIPMGAYDTDAEVDMEEDSYEEDECSPPKLIWQEGKAKCLKCGFILTTGWECPECESKELAEIKPIHFSTWEEADIFAGKYWENLLNKMKIVDTEQPP